MYEHNALGYWSGLALCLTKVRSSRARCPATALIKNLMHCIFKVLTNKNMHKVLKMHKYPHANSRTRL